MQKKILILNGSHSEIPLIQAAKQLGLKVITTGNAPHLIGHNYADEYHCADFSNKSNILSLSKELNINYICSSANDFGAITASYVSEKMGLSGHDSYQTALTIHHKDQFKQFALAHDIPTPYAESFCSIDDAINAIDRYRFPLIIKPVDMTGGKGISKIEMPQEYEAAIHYAFSISKAKRIVVEEFIQGTQHSFSTFISKGKVVFYFSDNEYSYLNPYLVTTSAAPATNINQVADKLVSTIEKIATLLNLKDGIVHLQYLLRGDSAYIIEITRRCSGDLYPYPVNYATTLDWAQWIVKAEMGLDCGDFPNVKQTGYCGRHCIMGSKNGVVKDIIFSPEIQPHIYEQLMWWKQGDIIDNYLVQKLGLVFFHFSSVEEMQYKVECINDYIKVIYQ